MLSLGLGIGVNTALFSLGMQFLFSNPSVRDADSLVYVKLGGGSHARPKEVEFLRNAGVFEDVAGVNEESVANFNDGAATHRIFAEYSTKNYFAAMGVPVLHGRGIVPGDPDTVAVLHYRFWRKYFNGDPAAIGKTINLDGRLCTIVGILPEHHRTLLGIGFTPDVFVPHYRDEMRLAIYGRLKAGMTPRGALAAVVTVAKRMDKALPTPEFHAENCSATPIAGFARLQAQKETLAIGAFFGLVLLLVGLVLLIACLNVASLLLARASARRREFATRLALGSSRGRLLQQFLAESLLLSCMGAVAGLALAELTAFGLARVNLPLPIPVVIDIRPDWRVAIYSALLTIFAAIACGVLPAWQATKEFISGDLHREGKMRLRRFLVVAQIATSVVVLTTGFLFLRNLADAGSISPGFDVRRTLRADVNLPPEGYADPAKRIALKDRVLRELATLPGIEAVAAARTIPFTDATTYGSAFTFADNHQRVPVHFRFNSVSPAFFHAMDIPLLQGRDFADTDKGVKSAIVSRTFVAKYFGGRAPLSTVFEWGGNNWRVVGVVEGTKTMTIGEDQVAQFYEPFDKLPDSDYRIQFVLRSAIPPAVRRALHRIEPMAGAEVETMYSTIGFAFLPSQIGAVLLGSIGLLGLVLATVGLYGVMVYSVTRRTREIGVRMAIGATRRDISAMVLRDAAWLTITGSAIGLAIALLVTKPLAMFLVAGLKTTDPVNYLVVAVVMIATGLVASWGPMRRAVAVDPNAALREE